jgi:hypothetical protein
LEKKMNDRIDPDASWLYRVGGVSALALGIGYIVIVALYVPMGAPPHGAEARLEYMAGNTTQWWTILGLSVLTDLLFLPLAMSLYVALERFNRNAMLLAVICVALFVVLDLAVTWTNYAALITLSGRYAQAAGESQRAAAIVAAEYPSAVVESTLLFFYNTLVLALGILITGFVMLSGAFSKTVAYLGLTTGVLGVVSVVGPAFVSGLSVTIIITSVLTTVWLLLVGYRLCRLGRPR